MESRGEQESWDNEEEQSASSTLRAFNFFECLTAEEPELDALRDSILTLNTDASKVRILKEKRLLLEVQGVFRLYTWDKKQVAANGFPLDTSLIWDHLESWVCTYEGVLIGMHASIRVPDRDWEPDNRGSDDEDDDQDQSGWCITMIDLNKSPIHIQAGCDAGRMALRAIQLELPNGESDALYAGKFDNGNQHSDYIGSHYDAYRSIKCIRPHIDLDPLSGFLRLGTMTEHRFRGRCQWSLIIPLPRMVALLNDNLKGNVLRDTWDDQSFRLMDPCESNVRIPFHKWGDLCVRDRDLGWCDLDRQYCCAFSGSHKFTIRYQFMAEGWGKTELEVSINVFPKYAHRIEQWTKAGMGFLRDTPSPSGDDSSEMTDEETDAKLRLVSTRKRYYDTSLETLHDPDEVDSVPDLHLLPIPGNITKTFHFKQSRRSQVEGCLFDGRRLFVQRRVWPNRNDREPKLEALVFDFGA